MQAVYSSAIAVGGGLAFLLGPQVGVWLGWRWAFTALGAVLSTPLWAALLFSDTAAVLLFANFVLLGVSLMWLGPAAADVHEIAGPHPRGLGVGLYFFSVNLAAYGFGAPLIGRLNDWLGAASQPGVMRYALLVCPAASALAALLLWRGSRLLARPPEA